MRRIVLISKLARGSGKETPMSPFLFNLVGDGLSKMLAKATHQGLVHGLLEDFKPGGIVYLQYADDTILFSRVDDISLRNLKGVLCGMSGSPA
jgi:hypothetical protein